MERFCQMRSPCAANSGRWVIPLCSSSPTVEGNRASNQDRQRVLLGGDKAHRGVRPRVPVGWPSFGALAVAFNANAAGAVASHPGAIGWSAMASSETTLIEPAQKSDVHPSQITQRRAAAKNAKKSRTAGTT